jgi:FkbM family methyltransferase
LFRLAQLIWNATMTDHGRRNVRNHWRDWRLRTFTAYGSGRAALYRLRGGRRFVVHPGDALSTQIAISGSYEPLESGIAARVLRPGDLAFDIGANIGYYTVLFSKCVGPDGKVFAFEPGLSTFAKLQTTINLLGLANVEAHPVALADRPGRRQFVMSTSGNDAQQSLNDWDLLSGSKTVVEVDTKTVDDFLNGYLPSGGSPAFVKCDVEGAEVKVLLGGRRLLNCPSPPVLMIEVNRKALATHKTSADALLGMLRGYHLYFTPLDAEGRAMHALDSVSQLPEMANVVAFPGHGVFAGRLEAAKDVLPQESI